MVLQTNTVKISGVPSDEGWSASFEFSFKNERFPHGVTLFLVFSTIRKNMEFSDSEVSRKILQRFQEEYLKAAAKPPDLALKDAARTIFDEFFQKLDGLEVASACYLNGTFYSSCLNGGKLSLYRDGFLVKILDSVSPRVVSASGYPKEGDYMLLATSDFFKKISPSELKGCFSKGVKTIEEVVSLRIHATATASVAVVSFGFGNNFTEESVDIGTSASLVNIRGRGAQLRNMGTGFLEKVHNIFPKRRLFLNRQDSEVGVRSRKLIVVGVILTLLLGISIFFGVYKNKKDAYKNTYSERLAFAKTNIEDAISMKAVDISRSRELFMQGGDVLQQLVAEGIKDPEIDALTKMVSNNKGEILGEKEVSPQLWLDLTLVVDNFSSDSLASDGQFVYNPDFLKRSIISVDLKSKRSATVKIPENIGASAIIAKSTDVYLLGNDGLYALEKSRKEVDKTWSETSCIAGFASNIYFLDTEKGEILKSSGTEAGFSEAKKWTTSEREGFDGVKSFVVDGFAWVLKNDTQILKFSYGNGLNFQLKGYPYELPNYDLLATDENSENLYLLVRKDKKISVFDKTGRYQYNLNADVFGDTKDFLVFESESKIILLAGEKLYEIKI